MVRAFSLIELLVVIAIISILAAVAVPAYVTYVQRAKVATAMAAASGIADGAMTYFERNGSFPSLQQLGYNSTTETYPQNLVSDSVSEYAAPPYLLGITYAGSAGSPGNCAGFDLGAYISNYDSTGGYTSSNPDGSYILTYTSYYLTAANTWQGVCETSDTSSTTSIYGNLTPNCYNTNSAAGLDALESALLAVEVCP